jgi:hypothetical protein
MRDYIGHSPQNARAVAVIGSNIDKSGDAAHS